MTAGEFAVLALEDVRRDPPVLVSSRGVGYGVGQLLPIIVQSLLTAAGMILVEQPEVHLHPRLQSAVGDLFVDTVVSGRAQLLVETHSEHLVLRLLRRVREGVLAPADLADPLRRPRRGGGGVRAAAGGRRRGRPGRRLAGRVLRRAAGRGAGRALVTREGRSARAGRCSAWGSPRARWAIARRTPPCAGRSTRSCSRTSRSTAGWCSPRRRTSTCSSRPWRAAHLAGQGVGGGAVQPARSRSGSPGRRWTRSSATSSTRSLIDSELADDLELVLVEADQAELLGVGRGRVLGDHPVGAGRDRADHHRRAHVGADGRAPGARRAAARGGQPRGRVDGAVRPPVRGQQAAGHLRQVRRPADRAPLPLQPGHRRRADLVPRPGRDGARGGACGSSRRSPTRWTAASASTRRRWSPAFLPDDGVDGRPGPAPRPGARSRAGARRAGPRASSGSATTGTCGSASAPRWPSARGCRRSRTRPSARP